MAEDEAAARVIALRRLTESPRRIAAEVWTEDRLLFKVTRADLPA